MSILYYKRENGVLNIDVIVSFFFQKKYFTILLWDYSLTVDSFICFLLHENYQVKCDMGNNPVIFLPTHRSYADFILMAYICFEYNIEIPAVVAGMGK